MNNHTIDVQALRKALIEWGQKNFRSFPWRETEDPYRILVAEVLLHRTRAEQVIPVYLEFVQEFPDVESLARAPQEKVLRILYPLGLHWRSELLHKMAQRIVADTGGKILADSSWLRSLPGVSDYIASAVLCLAFNMPEPLLDTNTVRVTGRLFGLPVKDSSRRSRKFRELYFQLLDRERPREFNLAVLDLGALICRPRDPHCQECPIRIFCRYGQQVVKGEGRNHA